MLIGIKNKGQGLLETIVAIGIILTGLVSSLTLVIFTLSASRQSADAIIASNLAWEGIEVVRNIRDSNYLAGVSWDAGLAGADTTAIAVFDEPTASWALNFTPNFLDDTAARMFRSSGVYLQNVSTPPGLATDFFRLIIIDPEGTVFRKRVASQVRWIERGVARSVIAETRIFDWR